MFKQSFDKYACEGDKITCEVDGFTATARIYRDDCGDAPDEWFYCGVAVTIDKGDVTLTGRYQNALWGIECNHPGSDNSYLRDVANELLPEALALAKAKLKTLKAG